jgi:hypothetical protein
MARASIVVAIAVALAGCSGPGKPAPVTPPVARPIAAADLQGAWRATDVDGWIYELSVRGETYLQTIRRTAGGPCVQKGTLIAYDKAYGSPYVAPNRGGDPGGGDGYGGTTYGAPRTVLAFVLTLEQNQCNADYTGAQLVVLAQDFDGERITLRSGVGSGGAEESHRYERYLPAAAPAPATGK